MYSKKDIEKTKDAKKECLIGIKRDRIIKCQQIILNPEYQ